jgi:hypothetical protein
MRTAPLSREIYPDFNSWQTMSYPVPMAEFLMWSLADEDLVRQRELFPQGYELGWMLWQRRRARRAHKQWHRFVVKQTAARLAERVRFEMGQVDMAALAHTVSENMATIVMTPEVHERIQNFDPQNPLQSFNIDMQAMQQIGEAMESLGDWRSGETSFEDTMQRMLQPQVMQSILGAFFGRRPAPVAHPWPQAQLELAQSALEAMAAQVPTGPIHGGAMQVVIQQPPLRRRVFDPEAQEWRTSE